MTLFINTASEKDANDIYEIMSSCTDWLRNRNMEHWINAYPLEKIKSRIAKGIVYKIVNKNEIIGTISLASEQPPYYSEKYVNFWESPDQVAFYISGLAISPKHMGKGYATKLLKFVEKKAKDKGIKYIRFDAVSCYQELIEFYKRRGYNIVATRVVGKYRSHFFEKCLAIISK